MNESFLITSDNYKSCSTQVSGFLVYNNRIYTDIENDLLCLSDWSKVNGAYVVAISNENTIQIHRDSMGLIRLYCFQKDGYWAISNSFWELCDNLKDAFPLSLNVGYAETLVSFTMTSFLPFESLCSEIKVLSAFDVIQINKNTGELLVVNQYPLAKSLDLDSKEAFELIDEWISYWGTLVKSLELSGASLEIDLSGGYDSRLSYALARTANVDFTRESVQLYSFKSEDESDNKHFSGDYIIAESLAQIDANKISSDEKFFECREVATSIRYDVYKTILSDCVNQPFDRRMFYTRPLIKWGGYLGETIRGYESHYNLSGLLKRCSISNGVLYQDIIMGKAIQSIMRSQESVSRITHNYDIDNRDNALQYGVECLDGAFFGKQIQQYLKMNVICLSPFMDISLRKIKIDRNNRRDILFAVILDRIFPEALSIPFSSESGFSADEIQYARELNTKYESNISIGCIMNPGMKYNNVPLTLSNEDSMYSISQLIVKDYFNNTKDIIVKRLGEVGRTMCETAEARVKGKEFYKESYMAALNAIARMIFYENKIDGCGSELYTEDIITLEELLKEHKDSKALLKLCESQKKFVDVDTYIELARNNTNKELWLYGSGEYARELTALLDDNGIKVDGFIVTKRSSSVEIMGKPVVSKNDFSYQSDKMIIIPAVSSLYRDEVEQCIKGLCKKDNK